MRKLLLETWKSNIWLRIITLCSILFIIGGFLVPPMGVIDGSVLTAIGELGFFGALFIVDEAIRSGKPIKFKKGDTSISTNERDEI